jgi:hypothetical protein
MEQALQTKNIYKILLGKQRRKRQLWQVTSAS